MRKALRKVLKIGLGVVLLVVVLAAAAWLLRKPLFGGHVKRAITDALADATGGRYEIGDLGGNWITDLRVLDVRTVEAPPSGALERLAVAEVAVRYDIRGLLGDDPLAAIEDVRMRGVDVVVDPGRPSGPAGEGESLEWPKTLRPTVAIDGTLRIASPSGPAVLDGVHLAFGPGTPLDVDVKEVRLPDRFDVRGPLAGRIERSGKDTYRWSSDAVLGDVRVPTATFTTHGDVTARVEAAGGVLALEVVAGVLGVTVERVDLARLPAWVRIEGAPTQGVVEGRVTARVDALPALSFDLVATGLAIREEPILRLGAKGRWDGERTIRLESLDAKSAGGTAFVRRATLDLELPWMVREAEEVVVEVASLRSYLPDLERDLKVSVKAASTEPRRLDVERLAVSSGEDQVEARGALRLPADPEAWRDITVEGTFEGDVGGLAPLDVALEGRLALAGSVAGSVSRPRLDVRVDGRDATIEGYEVGRAVFGGVIADGGIEALRLEVTGPFGEVEGVGSIRLEPLALDLSEVSVEVAEIRRLATRLLSEGPAIEGAVSGAGRLRLDGEALDVQGRLTGSALRVDGEVVGTLDARLRSDGRSVLVDALDARGPWGRAQASGSVDPRGRTVGIEGLVYRDGDTTVSLRAPLALAWTDSGVVLTGLDVDLAATRVRAKEPFEIAWADGVVDVVDAAVLVGDDVPVRASVRIDIDRETALVGDLEVGGARLLAPLRLGRRGDVLDFEGLDVVYEDVRAMAAGRVDLAAREARVESLLVSSGDHDARLRAPVTLRWTEAGVAAESLDVEAMGARIRGRGVWGAEPVADLQIEDLRLERLADGPAGTLRGWVRLGDGTLTAQAEVEDLGYEAWRGKAGVILRQEGAGPLTIERLRIHGPEGGSLEGRAVLPLRVWLDGLAHLDDVVPEFTLEGTVGGLGSFTEVVDGPLRVEAHGKAGVLEATVRIDDVALCHEGSFCDDGVLRLRVVPDEASLRVALANDDFAQLRGSLAFDRSFDWTRPEEIATFVEEARVDGEIHALVKSWKPLAAADPGFKHLEGAARVDVAITGPARDPSVRGVLTLRKFSLGLETDVAPFREIDARVVFEDRVIRIEQFEGLMGYAPFEIGGEVRRPFGGGPELDLTLHGRNTQLLRTDWTRMRIDIDATVKGPVDSLLVAGEGRIVDATFSEPVSLASAGEAGETPEVVLFDITDWPFSEMRFDLKLEADESIRIRNNLLRTNVSFDGALKGTGLRPEPVGRAWFKNADIFLPLTTLRDGEGEIHFLEETPFRPRIQMTARTRTRGYELGAQIAGTVPDLNLHVFTEPWLDDEDAILMLTTGSTGAELADGGIVGKALSGVLTVFGGSLFTTRTGEGEPGGKAFFERFEFTTDWEGSNITRIDGEIELTEKFYLHLETDRFDASNLGLIWRIRFR